MKNTEDSLQHYGVKGQKWGVRNDTSSGSSAKTSPSSSNKPTPKSSGKAATNSSSTMHSPLPLDEEQKKQYLKLGSAVAATVVVSAGALTVGALAGPAAGAAASSVGSAISKVITSQIGNDTPDTSSGSKK